MKSNSGGIAETWGGGVGRCVALHTRAHGFERDALVALCCASTAASRCFLSGQTLQMKKDLFPMISANVLKMHFTSKCFAVPLNSHFPEELWECSKSSKEKFYWQTLQAMMTCVLHQDCWMRLCVLSRNTQEVVLGGPPANVNHGSLRTNRSIIITRPISRWD